MQEITRAFVVVIALSASGCALFETPEWARQRGAHEAAAQAVAELPPIESNRFVMAADSDVVGEVQVIRARYEDTFVDIARAYDLGYDELEQANPGVDPWLPGAGTRIVLPTQFILPDAPREGIVLNIGAKRIFYYPQAAAGESPVVVTHPVGIGREGWGTPIGTTTVVSKVKDPVWTVPASIRKEHADAGDPLPAQVPAGPDNPLGAYALRLGFPSYLIHGTNKPSGIGMRVSHGCVQLFPEDIESLFSQVPVGTRVRIVNQPQLLGWHAGNLYLEVHPALEDDRRNLQSALDAQLGRELKRQPDAGAESLAGIDKVLLASTVVESRGFPVRLLEPAADAPSVVARARPVINIVVHPAGADAAPDPAPALSLDAANR
ncbi:MAG: L,D-transpeptidase family protein [Gammaproteobacteria bacterium]|nr:L,D-transpeptidase family protein [Gammaproteobacteria bacterium]